jgi:hypothetical protein
MRANHALSVPLSQLFILILSFIYLFFPSSTPSPSHTTHNHARQKDTHAPLHILSLFRNHQAHALGVEYVLQVEPDVRPIRAGWLSQAATLAAGYEQLLPPEGA